MITLIDLDNKIIVVSIAAERQQTPRDNELSDVRCLQKKSL